MSAFMKSTGSTKCLSFTNLEGIVTPWLGGISGAVSIYEALDTGLKTRLVTFGLGSISTVSSLRGSSASGGGSRGGGGRGHAGGGRDGRAGTTVEEPETADDCAGLGAGLEEEEGREHINKVGKSSPVNYFSTATLVPLPHRIRQFGSIVMVLHK